jgi:monoamine oxidase
MASRTDSPPAEASVVIVGAGLSGLVAAHELEAAGHDSLLVLEAQDRVGGRAKELVRPNGRELNKGPEFVSPHETELPKLCEELGIALEPLPWSGKSVRCYAGRRYVEAERLDQDPPAAAAYRAAIEQLGEMLPEIPAHAPWDAPHASEWDQITVSQWLDQNLASPPARFVFEKEFILDMASTSLLYFLWWIAKFGDLQLLGIWDRRFVGGTAQLPRKLAAQLRSPIHLSVPVRKLEHDDRQVTVHYDGGKVAAEAVILAIEPGQASTLHFAPPLSPARDLLQKRWTGHADCKYFAIYDTPFWREEGLSGAAMGPAPIDFVIDLSPWSNDEGILCGKRPETPAGWSASPTGEAPAKYGEFAADSEQNKSSVIEQLALYFGDKAREPKEFYAVEWAGDPWSRGCGATQLAPGLLSTIGHTLAAPIGRIVWAGADLGDGLMEGAVTSGQRAAREAAQLIARKETP